MKSLVRRAFNLLEEAIRLAGLVCVLSVAARLLPRALALFLADLLAATLLLLPYPGWATVGQMSRVFGNGRLMAVRAAFGWLACPLRDFVVLKRVAYQLERPADWNIIEHNAEGIRQLRKAGTSFIVATGHFTRRAFLALFSPSMTSGRVVDAAGVPPSGRTLRDLRIRVQYKALQNAFASSWDGRGTVVPIGESLASARKLLRELQSPGTIVTLDVDAFPPKTAAVLHHKAFAGNANRAFATGAVHLAQLAACPIVPCSYALVGSSIVIEWGEPVMVQQDPLHTLDVLLKFIEDAVARRPAQYVLDIGRDRRWNTSLQRWHEYTT